MCTVKLLIEAPDAEIFDLYPWLVLEIRLILETRLLLKHCQVATMNLFFRVYTTLVLHSKTFYFQIQVRGLTCVKLRPTFDI